MTSFIIAAHWGIAHLDTALGTHLLEEVESWPTAPMLELGRDHEAAIVVLERLGRVLG